MSGSEQLAYAAEGVTMMGELYPPAVPANGRAALVLHEADGIGGNVRRRCAMLAALGYTALAADLHGEGRTLASDEIGPAMAAFRADPARLRTRVEAGLDALCAAAGLPRSCVIAIGYCFGGMAALELARGGVGIRAVASFHGLLTTVAPAAPGAIRSPVLACTGARDPLVPPADLAAFQAEMEAAGANWQLAIYGRALHSFTNAAVDGLGDPRMAYDPAADRASWAALLHFVEAAADRR